MARTQYTSISAPAELVSKYIDEKNELGMNWHTYIKLLQEKEKEKAKIIKFFDSQFAKLPKELVKPILEQMKLLDLKVYKEMLNK